MKQLERPARGRGLVIATGVVVALGCGAYAWMNRSTAPDAASGSAPAPVAAQVVPPANAATATAAPTAGTSPTSGAQLPATPPPGIVLVSTVPNAQPPQATLLVDGRLQSQPLGSSIAGAGLQIRGVTAESVTLGQQDGPPLYTLHMTSTAETTRLMAETRAQRLAERQPTLVQPVGDPVVQRNADHPGALPDEMKVTVPRRQPVTSGPVGSL
ncbi:MAG: hypothetical protein KAX42_05320 [Sphaerotilus sp.]|jgi:hypothetical protein|nr:hypothetical protein [Sphaerotilus sp.]